jgi:manganese/iron transport system permease protein
MSWWEAAMQPLSFVFMLEAFAIAILVAIPTALLSCYLVLRGWALMGDAISHAVLPGIVLAYMANIPLTIGAFSAGMICALGTGYIKENSRIKEDTVMAIVFSGMFGLGLVLYTKVKTEVHLDHILFGDMLGVFWPDLVESAIIACAVLAIYLVKGRDIFMTAFDPQHAQAIGLPVRRLHYGILVALSLTIVGALKSTGIILTIAMLVSPGAIAFLWARRWEQMLVIAVILAVTLSILGVYISFFLDSAPAPTIVLLLSAAFIVSLLATTWRRTKRT